MAFIRSPNLKPLLCYIALYLLVYFSMSLMKGVLPAWLADLINIIDPETPWIKMTQMFKSMGTALLFISDLGLAVFLSIFYFRLFEFNLWNNRYDRAGSEGFLRTAYRYEIVEKDSSHFSAKPQMGDGLNATIQNGSHEIAEQANLGFNTLLFHVAAYVALWLPPIFVEWLGVWCFPSAPLNIPTAITHCRMLFEGSKAILLFMDTKVESFVDANNGLLPAVGVLPDGIQGTSTENGFKRRRLLSPIGASNFSEVPLTICVAVMDFLIIPAIARYTIKLLFG